MGSFIQSLIRLVFWLAAIGQLAEATEFMQREAYRASRHGLISLRQLNQGLVGKPK